jgi:Cof subfamily protein (haloacid dehalogenase superfamily)
MSIRLVVSDVDGTLVTKEKVVTPKALDAIRRLRANGIKFSVISSRPPQAIKVVGDVIGLTDPVPAFNGGLLVGPDLKTIYREKFIEQVVVDRILQRLEEAQIDIWVYTDADWYVPALNAPKVEHEMHAVKYSPSVTRDFSHIRKDRVCKIVGVSEDYNKMAIVEHRLQQEFRGAASASCSQKYYLDFTHPDANKGEGVLMLSELLNIHTSEIACIGDMENDTYMFKRAGLSIAMGNATDEVKSQATHVTTTNMEEGFANAMERFILSPQQNAASNIA